MDRVQQTWDELGIKVRMIHDWVLVRTEVPPEQTEGGIWYPPMYRTFYEGPLHLRLVSALVLSNGPHARGVKVGERVCFQRKYFARWKKLADNSMVGWLHEREVTAAMDEGMDIDRDLSFPDGPKAIRYTPV